MSDEKRKPEYKARIGVVEAVVWKNKGQGDRSFYSVQIGPVRTNVS